MIVDVPQRVVRSSKARFEVFYIDFGNQEHVASNSKDDPAKEAANCTARCDVLHMFRNQVASHQGFLSDPSLLPLARNHADHIPSITMMLIRKRPTSTNVYGMDINFCNIGTMNVRKFDPGGDIVSQVQNEIALLPFAVGPFIIAAGGASNIFLHRLAENIQDAYAEVASFGLRNHRFFFMFVYSATLPCRYVFGFCWVFIVRVKDREHTSIWKAMTNYPASIVLITYTFIAVWFVGGLTVFHLYLISTNHSTYDNSRYRYDRRDNPYNRGVFKNFKDILFTSTPASKNKFRGKVQKEPDISPSSVGVGFVSPNSEKTMGDVEAWRKPVWDATATGLSEIEGDTLLSNDLHLLEFVEFKQRIKHIVEIIEEVKWENTDPDLLTSKFISDVMAVSSSMATRDRKSEGAATGASARHLWETIVGKGQFKTVVANFWSSLSGRSSLKSHNVLVSHDSRLISLVCDDEERSEIWDRNIFVLEGDSEYISLILATFLDERGVTFDFEDKVVLWERDIVMD